jgi:hypothetical protein
VGPRNGLDDVKERKFLSLPGIELRTLGHSVRSHSTHKLKPLYRSIYGPFKKLVNRASDAWLRSESGKQ